MHRGLLFIFCCSLFGFAGAHPTVVFKNGKIRTHALSSTTANWMAVKNGVILDVGSGSVEKKYRDDHQIDLQGKTVLPGFVDSHAHLTWLGQVSEEADLSVATSAKHAVTVLKKFFDEKPEVPYFIEGTAWDQSKWKNKAMPHRALLDKFYPDRPAILTRVDGHAYWVNTYTLKLAGLWDHKKPIEGGKIVRDKKGVPTGVLIDHAMRKVTKLISKPTVDDLETILETAVGKLTAWGFVGAHDAGNNLREIAAMKRLLRSQRVRFRFYAMLSPEEMPNWGKVIQGGPIIDGMDGYLNVRAIKLSVDGAMGSHGAALDRPYADKPKSRGLLTETPRSLEQKVRLADKAGFQVAVHAVGTRGNRVALDVFKKVYGRHVAKKRPRLEHAQALHKKDIKRIAKMGVVASMQPIHCLDDQHWVKKRIGSRRARHTYAWRSLLDAGAILAFGSDVPVANPNPFWGVWGSLTRTPIDAPRTQKSFYPEQSIRLEEAIEAYTRGAAYAAFQEKRMGSLRRGANADFILFEKDPYLAKPEEFKTMRVAATFVGGIEVWPTYRVPKKQKQFTANLP